MVRRLLEILGLGAAAFMLLAVAQEWSVFSGAWFDTTAPARAPLAAGQEQACVDSLRSYLSMMGHLYASDGDPRFAERVPAAPEVVDELLADIAYLRRNGRYQKLELRALEIRSVAPLAEDQVEIQTRENWIVRTLLLGGGTAVDPARGQIVRTRYRLERGATSWRVAAWLELPPEPPRSAPAGAARGD